MFDTSIKVKSVKLRASGIIMNKDTKKCHIIPKDNIMVITKNKIKIFSHETFTLSFTKEVTLDQFLDEIGIRGLIDAKK